MSVDRKEFEVELPAAPGSVTQARRMVLAWLGDHDGDAPAGAIALAVSEAVANSARHAYGDGSGSITVAAERREGRVWIRVVDAGSGFDPDAGSDGLGMMIISRLADEVSLRSGRHGTELLMAFDLRGPGSEDARRNGRRYGRAIGTMQLT